MCDCDFDPPKFFGSCLVKGRKVYQCCECLRDIQVGEQQEYVSGLWDGDFDTFRTCMQCVEVREAMQLECYAYGMLLDEISNGDHYDIPCVADFIDRRNANWDRLHRERKAKLAKQG